MKNTEYINPTKERPVFVAQGTMFGNIDNGFYKDAAITYSDNCTSIIPTFALDFQGAVVNIMEYAANEKEWLLENDCNLEIFMLDGSVKNEEPVYKRVFTLTQSQIKLI